MSTVNIVRHTILGCIILLLCAVQAFAQNGTKVPLHLSFQGVLIQPDGTVYPDGRYAISVKLFTTLQGGTPVYQDEISTTIVGGVFNLIIGEQEPLDDVDFTEQLWVEIGLPGTTQTAFEPRTRLTDFLSDCA